MMDPRISPTLLYEHTTLPAKKLNPFWQYLIGTVLFMALVVMGFLLKSYSNQPSNEAIEASKVRVYQQLSDYSTASMKSVFPNTEAIINLNIDQAFKLVYLNVIPFADHHYTLTGEYQEIFYAATGQLSSKIAEQIFQGLDDRLATSKLKIGEQFLLELKSNLARDTTQYRDGTLNKNDQQFNTAITITINDMMTRFEASDIALRAGATGSALALGVMATKAISVAVAKKLAAITAAKTAGKVAVKVIGVSTGATTGAMIGSVIPFAGTAVGGIIGGIVGWFTVDAAAIKVSEHFGRKDFEAELTALIDEQKAIVKSEFRKKVKDSMEEVMKASPEVIIGLGK